MITSHPNWRARHSQIAAWEAWADENFKRRSWQKILRMAGAGSRHDILAVTFHGIIPMGVKVFAGLCDKATSDAIDFMNKNRPWPDNVQLIHRDEDPFILSGPGYIVLRSKPTESPTLHNAEDGAVLKTSITESADNG